MPKDNDLEGKQDMGGKHGGQAGMPKPETQSAAQKAIARDGGDQAGRKPGAPRHDK
jgi:hypothetical protein